MTVTIDGTNGITTPSPVVVQGSTSGAITLAAPAVAGSNTITLPAGTGTAAVQGVSTNIVSATAVASTSGTAIDFTGIPSWVKRITVMFSGVSTSGTSDVQIQIGISSGVEITGYAGTASGIASAAVTSSLLAGAGFTFNDNGAAASTRAGSVTLSLVNSATNTWALSGTFTKTDSARAMVTAGVKSLAGVLDRVRITTVNGTDTFDAGTINILYE
jgi:hypothetical protein